MPKEASSPFTPGVPVAVDFFVGRSAEMDRLKKMLAAAARGRVEVGFLVGERGIGKSSLASFVRFLAEREQRMVALHTYMGGVTTLEELVRRILDQLLKESVGTSWFEKIKGLFGKHIRQVDLFGIGVEFDAPAQDLGSLVHGFGRALHNLYARVKPEKKGIFLVLDDINGLASSLEFANWLKSRVDEIATAGKPLPLCLLLVGIEERRQELIQLQPSLARVFDLMEIRPWSEEEAKAFFQNGFSRVGMAVTPEAMELLVNYAGGLPVFAHEIGDAAFDQDTDDRIDQADATQAVAAAASVIGRKYLEPQVVQILTSARYRSILRKLARDLLAVEFQRGEVMRRLAPEEQKVFDNFLRRMTKLGIISKNPEKGPGAYRFTKLLHHAYFWLEAETRGPQ